MAKRKRQAKQITRDEARYLLMKHLTYLVDYWGDDERMQDQTTKERLEGLLHSTLAALDGCAMGLPGFLLIPAPHPDDEAYNKENGVDYYPALPEDFPADPLYDVGGALHEELFAYRRGVVLRPENLYDFGQSLIDEIPK